jgi:hydroxymethylpyrimidine pyrophosphatase-like HAD family hydrolase
MPALRYRLLALDVDGTLLDPEGKVRPRVARAIRAARVAGCGVVLATGRRLPSVTKVAEPLEISTVILTDGTVVYDLAERRVLFERALEPPLVRQAIDLLVESGLPPILFESPAAASRIFLGPVSLDNAEIHTFLNRPIELVRLPLAELANAERVVGIIGLGPADQVARAAEQARVAGGFALVVWNPSFNGYQRPTLSLAPEGTSKGHALLWLAAQLGIPPEEVMAVGDYANDLSLIEAAGWGVAMGNATPEVKAAARAIVADNANDGVAEAIERWILG